MALTRDFRDTIRERAQREPAFRRSLLREGLQLINNGDFATGRAVLRNSSTQRLALANSPVKRRSPLLACSGCLGQAGTRAPTTSLASSLRCKGLKVSASSCRCTLRKPLQS
jgi:hypothetical protein